MRNRAIQKFILRTLIIGFLFCNTFPVYASVDSALQTDSARALQKLEILKGYPDGSLGLQNKITRSEFFTLVVRMMGFDKDTGLNAYTLSFKDLPKTHWAYSTIKAAVKHGIVTGYTDHTVAPDKTVTYAESLSVLIRVLGYEGSMQGKWPDNVLNTADQLGLDKNVALIQDKPLTRGEVSVLISNALMINFSR